MIALATSANAATICFDTHWFEAANSHLRISKKKSVLKAWGVKLAKRIGNKKALVAVARKLAIIMHRMWVNGSTFQHSRADMEAAA